MEVQQMQKPEGRKEFDILEERKGHGVWVTGCKGRVVGDEAREERGHIRKCLVGHGEGIQIFL